jgi:hypothetical protein
MTVIEYIRQYLKIRISISDDVLWAEIQAIAQQLGIDLNNIDEAYAQLIAEEIDKNVSSLSVAETDQAIAATGKNGKKSKKDAPTSPAITDSDPIERLKPVVRGLHSTISAQTGAMKDIVRRKVEEKEDLVVDELLELTNGMNANIVHKFTRKLEARAKETESFLAEFEGVFDEAFSGF